MLRVELPYYRGIYDVRRPDDPIALNWRVPEVRT